VPAGSLAGTEIGNCSGLIYQTAVKNDNKAFVGEVMKKTQGKTNSKVVNEILREKLLK
jgi:Asp-tRNA(Asn)/Glu-tRNA(Gln) amidotransferase B subunit